MRAASSGLLAGDPTGLTQKSISMGLLNLKSFGAFVGVKGTSQQLSVPGVPRSVLGQLPHSRPSIHWTQAELSFVTGSCA